MNSETEVLSRSTRAFRSALSLADDETFLRALWSVNAVQSGHVRAEKTPLLQVPDDLETGKMFAKRAIYPWELDTLANELLTTPKHAYYRSFDCWNWRALAQLANMLRKVENAEYAVRRSEISAFAEMGRNAARQFDWQRGFFNTQELYRSTFIYGQGVCADYLNDAYGINVEDLTFASFALMAMYVDSPVTAPADDFALLSRMGLSADSFEKVLSRIARPLPEMRDLARSLRADDRQTAFRPSILRRYPCIFVGRKGDRMLAPLPQLIAYRLTAGLFFDVVGGTGAVRNECGKRFESYALGLLSNMLPATRFEPEWRYKADGNKRDSSDILLFDASGDIRVAIECKGRWMSADVRFGEHPDIRRDYADIIKGVFQVWRFFSDCRRGLTGSQAAQQGMGVVLALDEWFAARSTVLDQVMTEAHALADASGPHILPEDRKPIAFSSINELERVLETATEQSLLGSLDELASKPKGWIFSSLHAQLEAPKTTPKAYPFEDALRSLLPWYDRIKELAPEDDDEDEAY